MPKHRGVILRLNGNTNSVTVNDGTNTVVVDRSKLDRKARRGLTDLVRDTYAKRTTQQPRV